MNHDRFHNQLALSIGYKLINDKCFTLEVEDSDDPWLTLKIKGHDDIRFKASGDIEDVEFDDLSEIQKEIKVIFNAVRQSYITANNCFPNYASTDSYAQVEL